MPKKADGNCLLAVQKHGYIKKSVLSAEGRDEVKVRNLGIVLPNLGPPLVEDIGRKKQCQDGCKHPDKEAMPVILKVRNEIQAMWRKCQGIVIVQGKYGDCEHGDCELKITI